MVDRRIAKRMGSSLPLWWLWWWPESQREALPAPEELTLRDGSTAWVRPIRSSDRQLHAESYERLSDESKFYRFLSAVPHMTESHLDRLVDDVDGVDHIAYYLFVDDQESHFPAGIGRIVRDPRHPEVADIGITVHDEFQGRGIATALNTLLIERRPVGVTHLVCVIGSDNAASMALIKQSPDHQITMLGNGIYEVRISLEDAVHADIDHVPTENPPAQWRHKLRTRDLIWRRRPHREAAD